MADIDFYLDQIKNAGKGEVVRDAIIAAIQRIQRDVHLEAITVKKNHKTYSRNDGGGWNSIRVEVPTDVADLGTRMITENGIYNANDDGWDGYSSVNVDVQTPAQGIVVSLKYGGYEEYRGCNPGGGVTFLADAFNNDALLAQDLYNCLNLNPHNLFGDTDVRIITKMINRTEITDSWAQIVANPDNYDVGQYKLLIDHYNIHTSDDPQDTYVSKDGDKGFTYYVYSDPEHFPVYAYKVGELEKPLEGHNGYAKSVWAIDTLIGLSEYTGIGTWTSGGIPISDNRNTTAGMGWAEDQNLEENYLSLRGLLNNSLANSTIVFPSDLAGHFVPVINKNQLITGGCCIDGAETIDKLWIPSLEENRRYLKIIRGATNGSFDNFDYKRQLLRRPWRSQGQPAQISYWDYMIRTMDFDNNYLYGQRDSKWFNYKVYADGTEYNWGYDSYSAYQPLAVALCFCL